MNVKENEADVVGVTLYPANYETVEMVTEQGEEILQQEFTDAQLFMHSIQELERTRLERKKKKQKTTTVVGSASSDGKKTQESLSPLAEKHTNGGLADADELMKEEDVTMDAVEQLGEDIQEKAGDKIEEMEEVEEEEEDVIDPRIHYRPMVTELQAAVAELHQMINSIDLIRRREFLEEMRCIRENTALKMDELEQLVELKTVQVKESSSILMAGVDALTSTVEKESIFFQGITGMLRKWKICAPIHGNIPKPFRSGEPLAVDCSFISAGSIFTPPTGSIADLSFAELCRTEKGLVRVKTPEEFLPRTIQVALHSVECGTSGSYTLPAPVLSKVTRSALERLDNTPEDLKKLDERNDAVLKAVQFSVFCEELFHTLMQEALRNTSNWTHTTYSIGNYMTKKHRQGTDDANGNISVLQVLDDEIRLRVNEKYHLTVKLIDVSSLTQEGGDANNQEGTVDASVTEDAHINAIAKETRVPNGVSKAHFSSSNSPKATHDKILQDRQAFLTETCRYTLLLLQQETRQRHGRKEISKALLYTGADSFNGSVPMASSNAHQSEADTSNGTLATVLAVVAHNLLKDEVTRYLDNVSATLAFQNSQVSSSGRVLEDGLLQPICDSVRGIFVCPRWKTCPYDSTLSAFDLSIGKNFTTEVLITGTRIRFEDGPASFREESGLTGLKEFVEKSVCTQIASALYRDALSFGLKQAIMDLDRASVRLFAAGEWNGTFIGEGRVADSKAVGSIYFEPYFAVDGSIAINCMIQAVDVSKLIELTTLVKSTNGEVYSVDWQRIPGVSDVGKITWLLQNTSILPKVLATSSRAHALANGSKS